MAEHSTRVSGRTPGTALRARSACSPRRSRRGGRRPRGQDGHGRHRARARAAALAHELGPQSPVAMVGVAGGLDPSVRPGDLVVATELWTTDSSDWPEPTGRG